MPFFSKTFYYFVGSGISIRNSFNETTGVMEREYPNQANTFRSFKLEPTDTDTKNVYFLLSKRDRKLTDCPSKLDYKPIPHKT